MRKLDQDQLERGQKMADEETKSQSFEEQVKTLLDKGYPEAAGMTKNQFLDYINPLKKKFRPGSVIVIPENMVPLAKQMTMVELDGKTGYTLLDISKIFNAKGTKTVRKPYLIYDNENGKAMLKISPNDCVKKFKKQGRFGYNGQEGIAVVTHNPEILKEHYIDLPGSCYERSVSVLVLSLNDGRPRLSWSYASHSDPRYGSGSCGSR